MEWREGRRWGQTQHWEAVGAAVFRIVGPLSGPGSRAGEFNLSIGGSVAIRFFPTFAAAKELAERLEAVLDAPQEPPNDYLRERVAQIIDELDHPALEAMKSWPKGAHGPIAIAAYESMAERQRTAVHMLRAALMRTSGPIVITDPEASERLMEIVNRRGAAPQELERCTNEVRSIMGVVVRCIRVEGHDHPHVHSLSGAAPQVEPCPTNHQRFYKNNAGMENAQRWSDFDPDFGYCPDCGQPLSTPKQP